MILPDRGGQRAFALLSQAHAVCRPRVQPGEIRAKGGIRAGRSAMADPMDDERALMGAAYRATDRGVGVVRPQVLSPASRVMLVPQPAGQKRDLIVRRHAQISPLIEGPRNDRLATFQFVLNELN
jgi:hypothetical protein